MSSNYVRTQIKSYLTANAPTENQIDFSAQFLDLGNLLVKNGLTHSDNFLGLQFLPSGEQVIGLPTNNSQGCFRELGVFLMHVAEPTRGNDDVANAIVTRGDSLLDLFRGARINNDIVIESVIQPNFDTSATLKFENGFQAAAVTVNFYRDYNF